MTLILVIWRAPGGELLAGAVTQAHDLTSAVYRLEGAGIAVKGAVLDGGQELPELTVPDRWLNCLLTPDRVEALLSE